MARAYRGGGWRTTSRVRTRRKRCLKRAANARARLAGCKASWWLPCFGASLQPSKQHWWLADYLVVQRIAGCGGAAGGAAAWLCRTALVAETLSPAAVEWYHWWNSVLMPYLQSWLAVCMRSVYYRLRWPLSNSLLCAFITWSWKRV